MNDWQKNNSWRHWLRHSILPLVCLVLFLSVPQHWLFVTMNSKTEHHIEIQLSKPTKVAKIAAPEIKKQIESIQPKQAAAQKTEIKQPPNQKVAIKPTPLKQIVNKSPTKEPAINASDVQLMMSKTTDTTIYDRDFSLRKNNNQFIAKQYVSDDVHADLPYLDESIDAPRLQMAFYSAGYMGGVERFFDKITYEKTFTTQYGTKIKCAVVGVLAICGWK